MQLPHEELLTGSDGAKNKDITQIDRITCFSSLCLLATPLFPFIVRNRSAPFIYYIIYIYNLFMVIVFAWSYSAAKSVLN